MDTCRRCGSYVTDRHRGHYCVPSEVFYPGSRKFDVVNQLDLMKQMDGECRGEALPPEEDHPEVTMRTSDE